MQSMASFVAQNVGAGLERRARRSMVTGMLIGGSIGIFIAIFSFFRGDLLAGIFSNDPAVIARAAEYLRGFAAPCATVFGIVINVIYFVVLNRGNRKPARI